MLARARALVAAIVLVATAVFAPIAVIVPPVAATSITVNTATDPALCSQGEVSSHQRSCSIVGNWPTDNVCSLRAAITSAVNNSNSQDVDCATGLGGGVLDVIQINANLAGSTLTLDAAQGPISILNDANNKFQIIGPTTNPANFLISGGDAIRIFQFGFVNVGSAWLTLANLTLTHGGGHTISGDPLKFGSDNDGGAIVAFDNTHLTFDNVVLSNNNAGGRGGAIFAQGAVEITNNGGAYVSNHSGGDGGAIFAFEGPITYNGYAMLMDGNSAGGHGGALAYNADTNTNFTHIERSLLKNNSATSGGGVYYGQPTINGNTRVTFELVDSTITGAGGVFLSTDSHERFRYLRNTFQDAGSIYSAGGGEMYNNIVIGSSCSGNQTVANYVGGSNLWSSVPVGCQGPGNIGAPTNVSATLAQNGGPNVQQTYKLTAGSNAIDRGNETYCGTIDARSVPRGVDGDGTVNSPAHGDCDIGSYEFAKYIVNFTTGTSTINENGGTAQVPVKLSIPDTADRPLASPLSVAIARDPSSTARATVDYTIPAAGVTFPTGSTDGTIVNLPITILQDNIAERNGEFVILQLTGGAGVVVAEPRQHNLSIQDDDQAGILKNDGGNGTTVSEAAPGTGDSFTISLRSQPDYSQPDPNDSNSVGPLADVTVHMEPDRDCTVKVGNTTGSLGNPIDFTILNANWQTGTTVQVFGVNDPWDEDMRDETVPHPCVVSFTFSSGDPVYAATTDRYDVNVTDNDVAGVTITQSGGSTDLVEGGATDSYTIVLNTPPDPGKPLPNPPRTPTIVRATPNVACSVGAGNGVAKDFAFDGNTWSTPQTVTVTANDNLTVELGHTCVITHTVLGPDLIYDNLTDAPTLVANITANIQDYQPPTITNDPPFADIATTGGILVDEATAGTPDTFTVVLERQPLNQNVQVVLTPSTDPRIPGDQIQLQNAAPGSPAASSTLTVTFTPANWNVTQTVRVFAVNDDYDETSPHSHHITATFTSTAVGFNDPTLRKFVLDGTETLNTVDIPVSIVDNDTSSVDVTESGGSTDIAEGGATDTFTVKLGTHPYNDVTVTVTPDAQCNVGNGAGVAKVLSFPHNTWNTPQTITVTAFDDDVIELAGQTCTITNVATSADVLYNNLAGPNVVAHITDNDLPQVLIATAGGVAVAEATPLAGDTYTVVLKSRPDANVTVNVSVSDGQTLVSSDGTTFAATASLTFLPATYSTPQTVSVRAFDDFVDEADTHSGVIGHSLTTTATGYATVPEFLIDNTPGSNVQVSIADNDTAGVTLSSGDASVDVTEGGTTDTFTIVLTSQPVEDVTVTPSSNGQCTVGGAVTFTPAQWNIAKTVSISAVDDPTVEGAHTCPVNAVVSSGDPKYSGIAVSSLTANITDNDTASILITATGASLSEAAPATTTSYSVVLGAQPLANVVVHATVSDGQTQLSAGGATTKDLTFTNANWDQTQTVTVWVVDDSVLETSPHTGVIGQSVTSTAVGFDSNPVIKVDGTATNEVHIPITDNDSPDLTLAKSDAGASVVPGGVATWTLSYANAGNQPASTTVITETVPANTTFNAGASTPGWSCANASPAGTACSLAIGTVAAAGSGTATFAATLVSPAPAGLTSISNTASIADDGTHGPDPNTANNTASDTTDVDAVPDLAIGKSDGATTAAPGATLVYGISYSNGGTQDATGVTITETVPANTTFIAASSTPGWSCSDGAAPGTTCTRTLGSLAVGASGTVSFAVKVASVVAVGAETLENTASIADDGANGAENTANNSAKDTDDLNAVPDLALTKSDGNTFVAPGGTATYTLTVNNVGTQNAKGVVLNETVPANSTFNAGASTAGWSCANGAPAATVCALTLGSNVNVGTPASATFAVTVADPVAPGVEQLLNTASVADDESGGVDPTPANNSASDTTPIDAAPELGITKTAPGATVKAGDLVVYTLNYSNQGTQGSSNLTLTETVPAGTAFSAADSSANWSCADASPAGTSCTLNVGTVSVNGGGTRLFAVRVRPSIPAGLETIANTVTIADDAASGPDHDPSNNSATATTPVDAAPDLRLAKTDFGAPALPGLALAYTLTYSNVGTQEASGVVITETVPANTTFNASLSTPGWSCTNGAPAGTTCTRTVGTVGVGAPATLQFAVTVPAAIPAGLELLSNSASIADDGTSGPDLTPADNSASDTTSLMAAPDLTIGKTHTGTIFSPGATITWTLTYRNAGNQTSTGVVLRETVPANTTFVAAGSTAGWSCANGAAAGTVCTLAVGTLNAGGQPVAVKFLTRINNAIVVNSITNTASISDDGKSGPDRIAADNSRIDVAPVLR